LRPFLSLPLSPASSLPIRGLLAHQKTLAIRRGFWSFGFAPLALVPASSLPPGAGNEYEYALNTNLYEAKKTKQGHVDHAEVLHRNLHATTIRPNEDGDVTAVPAVEQAQRGSP
jgi:hypothetical protein